tara:strand:- start:787 stop:1428 length:642 start_codon:yes stop_codon:yes gene_type:complete
MKYFVITILENEKSVEAAERCIESGKKFGYNIEKHRAFSPNNCDVYKVAKKLELPLFGFKEIYSRLENCIAGFLSHHSTWLKCVEMNEPIVVFEHDAIIVGEIPEQSPYDILSLGKPSYGKYNTPMSLGSGPLVSKPYFPGAHGYRITPKGANTLMNEAKQTAGPTDVYIHTSKFTLGEHYPWPVEARDYFTTIQRTEGCLAKHNYSENYEIL